MKKPSDRAKPFVATREHHHLELAEDYVEIVFDLLALTGKARTCEIAENLGVSHVTVIRSLERLKKLGYFKKEGPLTLTEKGAKLASFSKKRHALLLDYLIAIGVPQKVAAIDAEGMEHHISPETLEALQAHLLTLQK